MLVDQFRDKSECRKNKLEVRSSVGRASFLLPRAKILPEIEMLVGPIFHYIHQYFTIFHLRLSVDLLGVF
jgi:hypothetical protein